MGTRPNGKPPEEVEIYPGGDVVFLVGQNQQRFTVNSLFLTNASKPFAAMLGPYQQPEGGGPREIALPEDDAEAIKIIFNIVHVRNHEVPTLWLPDTLLEVALAADKYDVMSCCKWACVASTNSGTSSSLEELDLQSLFKIMSAAYLLDNAEGFRNVTAAMVLNHTASFLPDSEKVTKVLPCKVFRKSIISSQWLRFADYCFKCRWRNDADNFGHACPS